MTPSRLRSLPSWLPAILALAQLTRPAQAPARESIPGVEAAAHRPIHPILIRNDVGTLLRVTVKVGKMDPNVRFDRNNVRLKALSFTLAGTDLRDVESLQLLSSGGNEEPRANRWGLPADQRDAPDGIRTIGPALPPAAVLTFPVNELLTSGLNVFWLSARLRPSAGLSHRLAAACTAVATSAGILTPVDETPGTSQRIGFALRRHGDDGVDTYQNPVLITTAPGTLLCAYDMRWRAPGHDLQDQITIGLSRSATHGDTWEPVRIIMDMGEYGGLPREQNGCSDPGIIVDRQTGEILCFAVWMNGQQGLHQWYDNGSGPGYALGTSAQILLVRSRDDGRTWSKPENMTRKLKKEAWWLIAPAPQTGIQLADGTLVMPMEGRDETGEMFSTIMSSKDHGATWKMGTLAPNPSCECAVAELGDGSLMLNRRRSASPAAREQGMKEVDYFYRAVAVTRDLGATWEAHSTDRNTLMEPNCNAALLRADYGPPDGRKHVLLFSNPHTQERRARTHHTIQVSFNDGLSWPRRNYLLLDEGRGEGYSTMTRVDEDRIGIAYCGSQADIVFQTIPLDELLHR